MRDEPRDAGTEPHEPSGIHDRLRKLEALLAPEVAIAHAAERGFVPAWQRITVGEPRWPVSIAVVGAISLQLALPRAVATRPRWFLPAIAALLLIGLIAANPRRIDRQSQWLRAASIALIAVISMAN